MFTLRDLDELAGFAVMNIRTLNSKVLRAIGEKVRLLRKGGKFDKFESQSRFGSDADKLLREIQKEIDVAKLHRGFMRAKSLAVLCRVIFSPRVEATAD